jgi:uncharacterized protein (TIGR04222 family)
MNHVLRMAVAVALLVPWVAARAAPPDAGVGVLLAANGKLPANPFDWTGPDFLGLYILLLVLVGTAAAVLRWSLREPAGEPPPEALDLDPYEVAYLAGRDELAVNAAVASLAQRGVLDVSRANRELAVRGELPDGADPLERAVYRTPAREFAEPIKDVRSRVASEVARIAGRLQELGLLVWDGRARAARFVPFFLVLSVALFGAVKVAVGLSRHKPVGFLVVLCLLTVVVASAGFLRRVHRSRRGDRTLKQLREKHAALHYAAKARPQALAGIDLPLALGLFGLGVLAGGPLDELRTALRPPAGSSGCGGGCGSSGGGCGGGGGGGCGGGGGGCGGCGGD